MANRNNDQAPQAATTGADPVERSTALTKFDPETLKGISPAAAGVQRAVFLPTNFGEALEMSKMLASGIGVRPWCRGNVSACMMIVQQAVRWGMDPYAVANKSYFVNDQVAFESQLVNAVVNTSREIIGRLKIEWEGEGQNLVCRVTGRLSADPDEPRVFEQPFRTIKIKNSPLWEVNVKQQLAYHTTRGWARLYVPEVLLGIYTPDEVADTAQALQDDRAAPAKAPAPDRRAFADETADDAEFEPVVDGKGDETTAAPENGEQNAETVGPETEKAAIEPETAAKAPDLPANDAEWGVWERDLYAAMTGCGDLAALDRLRAENHVIEASAPKAVQARVADAFTDNIVDLQGK